MSHNPKKVAGEECTEGDDCAAPAICLGGRCCADSTTAKHCAACDDNGVCERCEDGFVMESGACENEWEVVVNEPETVNEHINEPEITVIDLGPMYDTFSREGSNCGAVHRSKKSFRFQGNTLLCDDVKVDDELSFAEGA